jgi:TRAP-type C4-dicarboxylate transport system permease small subunit
MRRLTFLEWVVALLMLGLVVVVFGQVALRYLTYQPLAWTEEMGRYLFIWLSLLGAAVGGRRAAHFSVDFVPNCLPSRPRHLFRASIRLVEASFYGLLAWGSVEIVRVAHMQESASIGIPMSIPYGALLVAGASLLFYSLRWALTEVRAAFSEAK